MFLYNIHSGRRRSSHHNLKFCAVLLLLLVPFASVFASPTDGDITLSTTVTAGDITQASEIWLARLVSDDSDAPAIGLRWAQDPMAWFPTWQLELVSTIGLLPNGMRANAVGDLSVVALTQVAPHADHTYQATLSYSPQLGALAVKVVDETEGRTVYADGFTVPGTELKLRATLGETAPYYVPAGMRWTVGLSEPDAPFIPVSHFETRNQNGAVRIVSPEPFPSGHYELTVEYEDTTLTVGSIVPTQRETIVPLPMDELAVGHSTLRIDYVLDGNALLRNATPLTLGRVDFAVQPVVTEHDAGVVETIVQVRATEAFSDPLAVELRASIEEIVWDAGRKTFDYVSHTKDAAVYEGLLDLSSRETQFDVQVPLPKKPGNWRIRLTPYVPLQTTTVHGNERLFSTYPSADVRPGDEYTFVILPDTQYFARSYPEIFTRVTDWITANAAERNIAAVLHVGDITDDNSPVQWENVHTSMSLLHDVVPYVFTLGNHDLVAPDGSAMRGHSRVNEYFPAEMATRYSNVAGTMVPGRMENHYSLLSIGGTDYLVISLEFWPPDEAVAWANEVAKQYPDHKLILLTHSFTTSSGNLSLINHNYPMALDPNTTVNHGVALWELLLRLNKNSFMTLSGHVASPEPVIVYRTGRNIAGNHVYQPLFNWQNQPMGGNGWIGLMTFKPDNTVHVSVFSPYLGEYADRIDPNGYTSKLEIDLESGAVRRIFGG